MSNLLEAMQIEQQLRNEGKYSLKAISPYLKDLEYDRALDYLDERDKYRFDQWIPEVYYVDIAEYASVTEDAIQNGKYGIYISNGEGIHAYHGNDILDYDLCEELGVRVVELNYQGGTIIGSAKDLSIIIVYPENLNLGNYTIINKIQQFISKYVPNCTVKGNDILIDGDKVCGSMTRKVNDTLVWACQITFDDYSQYIEKICHKKSNKKPTYIDNSLLNRNQLETEILNWLVDKQ